jgi:hypothetical protein
MQLSMCCAPFALGLIFLKILRRVNRQVHLDYAAYTERMSSACSIRDVWQCLQQFGLRVRGTRNAKDGLV